MTKKDFDKVMAKIEMKTQNRIIDFLKGLPFFTNWTRSALTRLHYNFAVRQLKKGQALIREGGRADAIYIVKKGDFEMIKKLDITEKKEINYSRYVTGLHDPSARAYDSNRLKNGTDDKVGALTRAKFLSNRKIKHKNYKVADLNVGQLIGEGDAVAERPYSFTVLCRSIAGEVFEIKREDFMTKIKRNEETWKKITQKCINQESNMRFRMKNKFLIDHSLSKTEKRESKIARAEVLLNRHELDKREMLNEIVNDFPYVRKQRRLLEEYEQHNLSVSSAVRESRLANYALPNTSGSPGLERLATYDEGMSSRANLKASRLTLPMISELNQNSSTERQPIATDGPVLLTAGAAPVSKNDPSHSIYLSSRINRHIKRFMEEKKDLEEKNREREERARPENKLGRKHAIEQLPYYPERSSRLDTSGEREPSVMGYYRPNSRYATEGPEMLMTSVDGENHRSSKKSLFTMKSGVSGYTGVTSKILVRHSPQKNGKLMPIACTFTRGASPIKTPSISKSL